MLLLPYNRNALTYHVYAEEDCGLEQTVKSHAVGKIQLTVKRVRDHL